MSIPRFSPFPLPLSALTLLPALAGCPSPAVTTEPVPNGDFSFYMADPADVTADAMAISVDTDALTLAVTLQDGSVVNETLVAHAADALYTDCYTNSSHATMDTYDVVGDPILVDGVALQSPVLASKCGGRPMLGEWSSSGASFAGVILYFE